MTGGLIQLVAYGVQNIFLTDDPQVTFFKVVYRRHTNFSTETIQQNFTTTPDFGTKVSCILSQSGDLIRKMYLVVTLPKVHKFVTDDGFEDTITKFAWIRRIGYGLIKNIEFELGGQIIDRQYGEWMHIWNQLAGLRERGVDEMIGDIDILTNFENGKPARKLYIPLQFWFCRTTGLALPIANLQYTEAKINLELRDVEECYRIGPTNYIEMQNGLVEYQEFEYLEQTLGDTVSKGLFINFDPLTQRLYYIAISRSSFAGATPSGDVFDDTVNQKYLIKGLTSLFEGMPEASAIVRTHRFNGFRSLNIKECFLLVEYVFLDGEERIRFAQSQHEYLIDTVLFDGEKQFDSSSRKVRLGFNHPTKELFFVAQQDFLKDTNNNDHFNYTDDYRYDTDKKLVGKNLVTQATIILNGQERISLRPSQYFNWVQPYQHHRYSPDEGINIYCFCLEPEKHQPSGTCNMSKIDELALQISVNTSINFSNTATMRVYTLAYNILRIANGLAGLVFT